MLPEKIERFPYNAIDEVVSTTVGSVGRNTDKDALIREVHQKNPLDHTKDEPIPDWCLKLLSNAMSIGMKYRCLIVLAHNRDIVKYRDGLAIKKGLSTDTSDKQRRFAMKVNRLIALRKERRIAQEGRDKREKEKSK